VGIENFGLINFALSLGIYFGAIIQFGFGITATRDIARYRNDSLKLSKIYSVTLSASVLLALVCALIFLILVLSIDKFNEHINLYLFTLTYVVFQNLFPVWLFQGMEKMKYITLLSLGASATFLISLFLFVKEEEDFVLVPLLNGASAFAILIMAIALIRKQFEIRFIIPRFREILQVYAFGRHAFITQFVPNLYTNSVTFFLGVFATTAEVGMFSAATKIIDALGSMVYVFSNTFLPYLSRNIEKHRLFQIIMLSVGTLIAVFLLIFVEPIVAFLYGSIDGDVQLYLTWLAVALPLIFVQVTYGQNYLMLVGEEVKYKNIILSSSIFSLSYSVPLIYLYGAWGSVFTLIFTRLLISGLTLRAYKKHASFKK
jgi:PST family polysaccharide transporter